MSEIRKFLANLEESLHQDVEIKIEWRDPDTEVSPVRHYGRLVSYSRVESDILHFYLEGRPSPIVVFISSQRVAVRTIF